MLDKKMMKAASAQTEERLAPMKKIFIELAKESQKKMQHDSISTSGMKSYERSAEEEAQMGQKTAARFSQGKVRHDLIAPWALDQVAQVYTYGTKKYDDDNWWKGLKWRKDVFGCILRHIWKWFRGEQCDEESGLHHLAHAAWNCFALMSYEKHGIGIDDRVPYELDKMDENERSRRIDMWKYHANHDTLSEYNGLKNKE